MAERGGSGPVGPLLEHLALHDFRGYAELDASFGPGPQLIWGPNAAGKTSLVEAIVLLAWGRSHRTSTDGELIRWTRPFARVEGRTSDPDTTLEVALVGTGPGITPGAAAAAAVGPGAGGQRKRVRVNGVPRRASALLGVLRVVLFAPEEMLLVAGSPGLRRTAIDQLAGQRSPAHLRHLATYTRALQQRNGLLRAIREEQAGRDELRFWDAAIIEAGGDVVAERLRALDDLAEPLARAHREIAPEETDAGLALRYETNAPAIGAETPRDALARRLAETAEKEIWNGATLVGPHRDDLAFVMGGRDLAGFGSRGQQRTAILALKLAELDLLTELDGRPPLLLLDDVFSELDPARRAHLVRRIAALPQAFVTTTALEDLDPELRAVATAWAVTTGPDGARLLGESVEAGGSVAMGGSAARGERAS